MLFPRHLKLNMEHWFSPQIRFRMCNSSTYTLTKTNIQKHVGISSTYFNVMNISYGLQQYLVDLRDVESITVPVHWLQRINSVHVRQLLIKALRTSRSLRSRWQVGRFCVHRINTRVGYCWATGHSDVHDVLDAQAVPSGAGGCVSGVGRDTEWFLEDTVIFVTNLQWSDEYWCPGNLKVMKLKNKSLEERETWSDLYGQKKHQPEPT